KCLPSWRASVSQASLPLKRQLQSADSFQISLLFFSEVPLPFQPPMYSLRACRASLADAGSPDRHTRSEESRPNTARNVPATKRRFIEGSSGGKWVIGIRAV